MKFAGTLKTFIQITILLICMLNITIASAVEFQARGSGIFQYDERFKKRNYEGYKEQAIKQAVQKAWSQYVSSLPQVKRSSYQRIEANFMTNLNRYISSVVVLDESHNKRTKTVEVLIRAAINDDEVNATLNANSAIKQAQASDDASYFSVVFLARKVTKVKQFRELETSIVAKEGVAMASESAVVSGTSISTSQSNESFSKTKTGGNTEIKRDILTYEVTSPASINSSMEEILSAREVVKTVYMDDKIESYILDVIFATRYPERFGLENLSPLISFGASPRGSINLATAAKAFAFIKRRGYVIPEDVRAICHDVLRHRIGITYEAEAENITSEDIIDQILNKVEVP